MEDVLEIYHRPYNPKFPVVCMDEKPIQMIKEIRTPQSVAPGKPARFDSEYERNGTASLFLFTEPLKGKTRVEAHQQRTMNDWAHQIQRLVELDYPLAEKIILVCDNLNTHKPAAFYQTFPPETARRILNRLEIHYTPKHGSWLNMAEIELSVLSKQCLSRRIPDESTLKTEIKAWNLARNLEVPTISWQFSTDDARIKLKQLYPIFSD
jgi:hypothetical protein